MGYKLVLSDPYLFSWDDIPGNDNSKLISFLNQRFDIEWVKTAKVEKIDNGKIIKISNNKSILSVELDDEKTKANLKINNGSTDELIAKMESSKLNIYEKSKDVGENVFFDNLPFDYEVYLLYYPGTSLNEELIDRLRNLGSIAGKNLFVNIAKLNDPNFKKIVTKFGIRTFPTIIVTAINKLASSPTENLTAYVKIDNKKLLNSPDLAAECIDKMFTLFIQGEIARAISEQKRDLIIFRVKSLINNALKGMKGYLEEWEISFSFITGTLVIKPTGGG